jgi:hypothetical protein
VSERMWLKWNTRQGRSNIKITEVPEEDSQTIWQKLSINSNPESSNFGHNEVSKDLSWHLEYSKIYTTAICLYWSSCSKGL